MDGTALNLVDTIERRNWVLRKSAEDTQLSIEQQAQLSIAATKKVAATTVETTTKKGTIEEAFALLDVDVDKPKSFGQEMMDLKRSLEILGKVIDGYRAIQDRRKEKEKKKKTPAKAPPPVIKTPPTAATPAKAGEKLTPD